MTNGFMFIATGQKYLDEATYSAQKLRESMPNANVAVVTDTKPKATVFDDVIDAEPVYSTKVKPTNMMKYPYDKTIFLDTEVSVREDISELFDLLEYLDLLVSPKQDYYVRSNYPEDIPDCYEEFNTGVIGLRKCKSTDELLQSWVDIFDDKDCHDQVSFRTAVYRSDIRYHQLPIEYNVRYPSPGHLNQEAKVFHTRNYPDDYGTESFEQYLKTVEDALNEQTDRPRTFRGTWYNIPRVNGHYRPHVSEPSTEIEKLKKYFSQLGAQKFLQSYMKEEQIDPWAYRIKRSYQHRGILGTIHRGIEKLIKNIRHKS